MTRRKTDFEKRLGRCYELSGRYVLDHPEAVLVHGSIQGDGRPRIAHAWVELPDGSVYDPVTDTEFPLFELYAWWAHAEVAVKYDHDRVCTLAGIRRHWGPWDDDAL